MTPMQEIKRRLIELGVPPEHIVGCTEAQIEEIMRAQRVSHLPEIYLDFLRLMGQGAGPYLDFEFFYPRMLSAKQRAFEELEFERGWRNELRFLPEDAFVFFFFNQGYQFYFIHPQQNSADTAFFEYLDESDKPDFRYHESLLNYFQKAVGICEARIKSYWGKKS